MSDLRLSAPADRRSASTVGVLIVGLAICVGGAANALARTRHRQHRHPALGHAQTRPTNGVTAHGQALQVTANTNQSNNWFGYSQGSLEQGGIPPKLFHSITGNWIVPKVSQHKKGEDEYSSDWIGIGGGCVDANCDVTDATLIQTGTEQDVSSSGRPSYSAWWEIVPAPSLTITSMTIRPGDVMHASISEASAAPELWRITLTDRTRHKSYSTTVPYTSSQDTAEWIEETPLVIRAGGGFAPLPNATKAHFDLATTNGAPANLKASEEMDMINSNGKVIGAPSAPDRDSDGFNVCAWASSCPAPSTS